MEQSGKDNLDYVNSLIHDCSKGVLELVIRWLEVSCLGQSEPAALLFRAMSCQISCMATVSQA